MLSDASWPAGLVLETAAATDAVGRIPANAAANSGETTRTATERVTSLDGRTGCHLPRAGIGWNNGVQRLARRLMVTVNTSKSKPVQCRPAFLASGAAPGAGPGSTVPVHDQAGADSPHAAAGSGGEGGQGNQFWRCHRRP